MSLITKRLSTLAAGTEVQVSYGFVEGQNLVVTGTVTDNDNTACLEIRDSGGCLHYLDYSTVKFLVLLSQETPAEKTVLLHEQPVQNISLCVSDRELKKLFDSLDRKEKQLLQKGLDSFFYGVRTNSSDKVASACETTRRTILREENAGLCWSTNACRLAALMLARGTVFDAGLFARAQMWQEAVFCHVKNNRCADAGFHTAMALGDKTISADRKKDLTVILARSCMESGDASVVRPLTEAGFNAAALVRDLILAQNRQPPEDPGEALELLEELYPLTDAGRELREAMAPEAASRCTGTIIKLLWVNNSGSICYRDGDGMTRTVSFRYSDIADEKLKAQVTLAGSDPEKVGSLVQFELKNGAAVQIHPAPRPMILAQEALREGCFRDAMDFCRMEVEVGSDVPGALLLMVQAALDSSSDALARECVEFCESHRENYPSAGKAVSLLARLYHQLTEWEISVDLTEQALADPKLPAKLHSGILCQYMTFSMTAYNETGDEAYLRGIQPKADKWLELYEQSLSEDLNCARKHSRVLRWKIHSLCARDLPEEAEVTYAELARRFPGDSKLDTCAEMIRQARLRQAPRTEAAAPMPAIAEQTAEDEPEDPGFDDPGYEDPDGWESMDISTGVFIDCALSLDQTASMLSYLKVGTLMNADIRKVYDVVSLASNNPLESNRYDTESLVRLMGSHDERYPELNSYCMAAGYLRSLFQYPKPPLWLRQSLSAFDQIPQLDAVHEKLARFVRETGHDPDRYTPCHRQGKAGDQAGQDLVNRAKHLYAMYMENPPRDSSRFARLIQTKKLAYGSLKKMLRHVIEGNLTALEEARENFCKQFNTDFLRVSPEKVDVYIAANWETAGKLIPSRESATLQGTRRNALRSAISSILGVINDCYRQADLTRERPTTPEGRALFGEMAPELARDLDALKLTCEDLMSYTACPGEKTGLRLLADTARELGNKLTGRWHPGQEGKLFCNFLLSGHVLLDEDLLPDFSATLNAWGPMSLLRRIEAHSREPLLTAQEHIDRIFSRDRNCQNFGTAQQLVRSSALWGETVVIPEQSERYVNQAKLMAQLDLEELRASIGQARATDADEQTLDHLERVLLHFYSRCCQDLQFGFLARLTDAIRSRLENLKGADAA